MIVFALSYNLLLGETGLLSFGHAAYAGLGAFVAAHVFNRSGVPLPLLPLIGGVGGALCGVLFGFISTRRAGTAFAMITLGIGELVAASVWLVPGWFGGEARRADRSRERRAVVRRLELRPGARGVCADRGVVRARVRGDVRVLAHAVRAPCERRPRQPGARGGDRLSIRVACASRWSVVSAFFAGVAGVLGLINVELVSAEGVGLARSGARADRDGDRRDLGVLRAGRGRGVLTFFSVAVASVSRAWLIYLGLFFVWVVVVAPDGLAGLCRQTPCAAWCRCSPRSPRFRRGCSPSSSRAELAYAVQFDNQRRRPAPHVAGFRARRTIAWLPWSLALALRRRGRAPDATSRGAHDEHRARAPADRRSASARRRFCAASIWRLTRRASRADRSERRGQVDALRSDRGRHAADERTHRAERHRHIRACRPSAIARHGLARSFQSTSVFTGLTVLDNLRCAVLGSRAAAWQRLMAAFAHDRPGASDHILDSIGLLNRRDEPAASLSYAEQRALDLGIALATGASVPCCSTNRPPA